MITSFFDGRVRIRDEALKDETSMAMVIALVENREGVTRVTSNPRTGSVLITYDPEKIPRETLLEAAAVLEKQLGKPKRAKSPRRKKRSRISPLSPLEESVVLGSLLVLAAVAGYGSKTLHVLLGLSFAVLVGIHVYDRKHCFVAGKPCGFPS